MDRSFRQRREIDVAIVTEGNRLAREINSYNTRVLICFLKEELSRDYDEVSSLKKEKFRIQMMLSKFKKDIFKEGILLDVGELDKVF